MKKNNVVIKKSSHSQKSVLGISLIRNLRNKWGKTTQQQNKQKGDPRQNPSGMTALFNNGGFTLIELLVVVLIIGILAAIAMPQYQLATEKTRGQLALAIMGRITLASEKYYLENGSYPSSLESLDITMPESAFFTCNISNIAVYCTRNDNSYVLAERFSHRTNTQYNPYQKVCGPSSANIELAKRICKALGADLTKEESGKNAINTRWAL